MSKRGCLGSQEETAKRAPQGVEIELQTLSAGSSWVKEPANAAK
jgi:hypothetical protein